MGKQKNNSEIEGGSPSRQGPHDPSKHEDDSLKPSKVVKEESIKKSEKGNMTDESGYNETPSNVPVKSTK